MGYVHTHTHTHTHTQIYFKELAHATLGAGKSDICRAGQQAGDPGKS